MTPHRGFWRSYQAIVVYHDFFAKELWSGEIDMSPGQAFLSMNAFMLFLSGVRMTMTGHVAATFPLFRTAMESACYPYLMKIDPTAEPVWSDRHKSEETLRSARRRFTSAVKDAARAIESTQEVRGHAAWIEEAYQSAIDNGAHPNPKSIYGHVQPPRDIGDHYLVTLAGLYDSTHSKIYQGLVACLDYGLILAVILAHGLQHPPDGLSEKLDELNHLKENLTTEHFDTPQDG
ncbi:hypothetical protein GOB25_19195 [Sinorhizobium meliloti]|nr:hypothetical protein [Sinorhizobium meliloti]